MAFGRNRWEEPYATIDPTRRAAIGRTATQSANAPFRKANQERARGNQQNNLSRAGRNSTGNTRDVSSRFERSQSGMGMVDPDSYGTDFIHGSNEWYGSLNQYGAQVAGASPEGFWAGYGTDVQGWQPGGSATAFMSQAFDPRAMGAAMYGSGDFTSLEEILGGTTGIANRLVGDGSRAMFVDPSAITGSIVNALKSGDATALEAVNPILASIINSNVGNPIGQIDSLISFLGDALRGSMPPDVLDAWLGTIERLGSVFASDMMHGDMKKMDIASFVGFLSQQLGPTLGL